LTVICAQSAAPVRDKKDNRTLSLLDVIEAEEVAENPELCVHRDWQKTETDWGGRIGWRLTWTCPLCKEIRGRA
jgi:hypothetical protein